jgi:inhibitor of cysteine peptidase
LSRSRRWLIAAGAVVAVILALTVLALMIRDESDGGAEVILTEDDRGAVVTVRLGAEFVIRLASNPSTGYSWGVAGIDAGTLALLNVDYVAPDSGLVGEGGIEVLRFRTFQAGQSTLALRYWRPWEGENSIAQRFEVTVIVAAD